ncbi:hypothetical protein [Bandra megavirus]|uniref:Bro-N domain-containing protein n=1 Tax=Bandra megavirus TaxID=2071566 RepID=A0A2K9V7I1_9VIRU|nr:hypothetical protein [Bandra megavirus]
MDNIFKYIFDNINIYVIKDENGIKWYKLLDVLKILNLKQKYKTVCDIVSNDYIRKYNTIKYNNAINIQMDKSNDSVITNESNDSVITNESNDSLITNQLSNKTLFINNCGLIQLLSKSNENNAKKLWFELCNNIIPIIYQRGIYIQNDNQSIDQYLNEHNYNDSLISEYKKTFAIYVAYIGEYDGIHLLIYGKTDELTKYKLLRCREKYIQFNVIKIWEILSNDIVINNIENQLQKTYYLFNLINLVSNDTTFNNLFPNLIKIISITHNLFLSTQINKLLVINQRYDIKFIIKTIDEIVTKIKIFGNDACINTNINDTKIGDQYVKKLKLLKQDCDIIQHKYHELNKLYKLNNKYIHRLELEFKNAEAIIHELRNKK